MLGKEVSEAIKTARLEDKIPIFMDAWGVCLRQVQEKGNSYDIFEEQKEALRLTKLVYAGAKKGDGEGFDYFEEVQKYIK